MYRDNYINSLHSELLEMVAELLTPVALRYGYSEVPLETNIKWQPLVLILGNYSSGKSTLINDFLGGSIQDTGQAPTDDSFTIIAHDSSLSEDAPVRIVEERDGKFLLMDPEFPFESLKRHGQRFAAHFRLKKVNSPFLKNLAIIDTPGMLDSITERDRGYDYQQVIGDLAQIADLILVLFDPHKAGTVREAHTSLRETLPVKTFEDRVLFVLNRVDECSSLMDLLRVYGTLCWNLSQITGRKDIPMIHMTYSPNAAAVVSKLKGVKSGYLRYLENQRNDLRAAIQRAPCHRLDNLATFIETHSERLSHFLEALLNYRKRIRKNQLKVFCTGLLLATIGASATFLAMASKSGLFSNMDLQYQLMWTSLAAGSILLFWMTLIRSFSMKRFHHRQLAELDNLTQLNKQARRDSWESIKKLVFSHLSKPSGNYSIKEIRKEYSAILEVHEKGSKDIREALKEISILPTKEDAADSENNNHSLTKLKQNQNNAIESL